MIPNVTKKGKSANVKINLLESKTLYDHNSLWMKVRETEWKKKVLWKP